MNRSALMLILGVACLAASAGCEREPRSPLRSNDTLLRYVPADTPFVFAAVDPVPDDVADRFADQADILLGGYREMFTAIVGAQAARGANGTAAELEAVADALDELFTVQGLNDAGFTRDSTMVLYGAGLIPVLRIALAEGHRFEETLARIELAAGGRMSVASIDGQSFRFLDGDEARFLLALVDDQLVLSVYPSSLSDDNLRTVLGLSLPDESIASTGTLADIAADYEFTTHFVAMFDVERVVATFLDRPSGVNAELLGLVAYDAAALTAVCKDEIRGLAGVAPRLLAGYTELKAERFGMNFVVELREDIAAGLASITAPVPGLGTTHEGLLSFGTSLDLVAARRFYSGRLDALEASPYQCEMFAGMADSVAAGRAILNQPLPPIIYSLKGFFVSVDDVRGMDLARRRPPSDLDASLLIATDNPIGLLTMGAMFSPEIAALNLQTDGRPVKVEPPQGTPPELSFLDSVYVAATGTALALSVGDSAETRLAEVISAPPADVPTVFAMDMDAARYYQLIAETMRAAADDPQAPEASVSAAMADTMTALAGMFSRTSLSIQFTERGIEMPSTVLLSAQQ